MTPAEQLGAEILAQLPYEPNDQQIAVLAAMARFLTLERAADEPTTDRAFLLNGYAGTGKTSLTGAIVRALRGRGRHVTLLAPTGRAAKVFGSFAGMRAWTIHRCIYRTSLSDGSMSLAENSRPGAVFIVDEASMIGEGAGASDLLTDLIHYVYSAPDCRLILLGDTAQLPPVGIECSPAMDPERLRSYGLRLSRAVLTRTVRQQGASGILWNATRLRRDMKMEAMPAAAMRVKGFRDVRVLEGTDLADEIAADYGADGAEETIVITRTNLRATRFNLAIRSLVNMSEEELVVGERLMVAKNNYARRPSNPNIDFIANGDMAVVTAVHGTQERYGLRFADVTLFLPDGDPERGNYLDCKIILDGLTEDFPALDPLKEEALRRGVITEAAAGGGLSPTECAKALRASEYYNALRVKYAYAVTCHKAQGGQWRNVYVDLGYVPDGTPEPEFHRWLYTAVTRATGRLSLVNPVIPVE